MKRSIHNIDCIEFMKTLDKCVNLVVTDPPYNVSRENNFQTMGSASRIGMDFGEWDKGFDITGWIKYLPNVLVENANVVIFNAWENLGKIKEELRKNVKRIIYLLKDV